jgi:hypothetical protein
MRIALVSNNTIVNVIVMDSYDEEFLESIKDSHNFDSYFSEEDYGYPISINWYLDEEDSTWKPANKPFPSYVFSKENGSWEPPIPYPGTPENPNKYWAWDEANLQWLLLDAPIPAPTGSIPNN